MFLLRLINELIQATAFPLVLLSRLLKPGSYKIESTSDYKQPNVVVRARRNFNKIPGYLEVILDTMRDEEMDYQDRQEICETLEQNLIRAINYAQALEA